MAEEKVREMFDLPLPPDDITHTLPGKRNSRADPKAEEEEETKKSRRLVQWSEGERHQRFAQVHDRFTLSDVDNLIRGAQEAALQLEGSEEADRLDHSQSWRSEVSKLISAFFEDRGKELTFSDAGRLLKDLLDVLGEPTPCRPSSMDRKCSVFPLPVPEDLEGMACEDGLYQGMVMALNSLHGVTGAGRTNPASLRAQKRLRQTLSDSSLLGAKVVTENFADFFKHRGVDYEGEEVKVAKKITWEGIQASLPDEVGKLDIRDFVEGGVLHFIDHFDDYLLPPEIQWLGKTPRTLVDDAEWPKVVAGLVKAGVCTMLPRDKLHHVAGQPLLNGLFAVSKDEMKGDIELLRLIMNLKPLNQNTRSLEGDTATLPSVTSLGHLFLEESQVLVSSSEDIRCFFYLFRLPQEWYPFLAFGRPVPWELTPGGDTSQEYYLTSMVLPMGYVSSVAIAQHIHRNVVRRCLGSLQSPIGGHQELRRDRLPSSEDTLFRVYLDNFDLVQKQDRCLARRIQGEVSPVVEELRRAYRRWGLPVHPKKTVQQEWVAEIQGALVDGDKGIVMAKPSKVMRYLSLTLEVLRRGAATQKELQVIGGGLVYVCMYRRPLLCALDNIWKVIVALEDNNPHRPTLLSRLLAHELVRFLCLLPLAYMSLRADYNEQVIASDASSSGGGISISRGLTPYGALAAGSQIRGDVPEEHDFQQILTVGLFDGISALRMAMDVLGCQVAGHVSVEKEASARRVVEAWFADTVFLEDVSLVTEEEVVRWSLKFPSVCLILVGAGPPCQGVSGLNTDRRGALRDCRSALFQEVPRVVGLVRKCFPWAQVHFLAESVASMDSRDCEHMNKAFEELPWFIDANQVSLCNRPRLYWTSWELCDGPGAILWWGSDGRLPLQGEVELVAEVEAAAFLETGWSKASSKPFPTFTTARPSACPLRSPAGLKDCLSHEKKRWEDHGHRFPPYQYKDLHCVVSSSGEHRIPNTIERETILGFPAGFTRPCMAKSVHGKVEHEDCRLSLLGNSWSVPVIAWLISCLLVPLGFIPALSMQDIVNRVTPGKSGLLQSLLTRPPLRHSTSTLPLSRALVSKLHGLSSVKGEDLLIQQATEVPVRHQRLRTSIPAKLWRWRSVAGWKWRGDPEHINSLELRAAFTSLRYRVEELRQFDVRCVHLVDSLVVLHCLARGRSSSRKLKRTMMRINSLLLVSGLQPLWAYVDTGQNPADRPSRWAIKKPWLKAKPKV